MPGPTSTERRQQSMSSPRASSNWFILPLRTTHIMIRTASVTDIPLHFDARAGAVDMIEIMSTTD
jgi:hypothetical protein